MPHPTTPSCPLALVTEANEAITLSDAIASADVPLLLGFVLTANNIPLAGLRFYSDSTQLQGRDLHKISAADPVWVEVHDEFIAIKRRYLEVVLDSIVEIGYPLPPTLTDFFPSLWSCIKWRLEMDLAAASVVTEEVCKMLDKTPVQGLLGPADGPLIPGRLASAEACDRAPIAQADESGRPPLRIFLCARVATASPGLATLPRQVLDEYASRALRHALDRGAAPFPWLGYGHVLDDQVEEDRAAALAACLAWIAVAEEVWVYPDLGVSGGMRGEIEAANARGIPIRWVHLFSE